MIVRGKVLTCVVIVGHYGSHDELKLPDVVTSCVEMRFRPHLALACSI